MSKYKRYFPVWNIQRIEDVKPEIFMRKIR